MISPRRLWLFRIGAPACAMMAVLVAAELVLRVMWGSPRASAPPGSLTADPDCHYINTPGFDGVWTTPDFAIRLRFNSRGLRDVEHAPEPEPGVFRILALGDSYVQGHGVGHDEMFATVAEKLMQPPPGCRRIEIIKAGFGGWGPVAEAKWLVREGLGFKPHAVLLFLFVGNDLIDAQQPGADMLLDGFRVNRAAYERSPGLTRLKVCLRGHVYLYGFIVDFLRGLAMSDTSRFAEDRLVLDYCDPKQPLPVGPMLGAYRSIRDACRLAGAGLRVVILPHRTQVDPERLRMVCARLGLDAAAFDTGRPGKELVALFREEGIDARDFTAVVREDAKHGGVGFRGDSHYTARTHRAVGRALAMMLQDDPFPDEGACGP